MSSLGHVPAEVAKSGASDFAISGPGSATVLTSCVNPKGGASHDPSILLTPKNHYLQGSVEPLEEQKNTYDTFRGPEKSVAEEWYEIRLLSPKRVNRLVIVVGLPYVDGGWWTSLRVEYWSEASKRWREVERTSCYPSYDFTNSKEGRRPFECYVLAFEGVVTNSIRLIGNAGGRAHFTSVSSIELHDVPDGHHPLQLHRPLPVPRLFKLITADLIWKVTRNFVDATGLAVHVPFLEFYSDVVHPAEHWKRAPRRAIPEEDDLWAYIGLTTGWLELQGKARETRVLEYEREGGPYVEYYFDGALARACAPVLLDGDFLATLYTEHPVPVAGKATPAAIKRFFGVEIDEKEFEALIGNSLVLTERKLRGVAGMLGYVAGELSTLATNRVYRDGGQLESGLPFPPSARRIVRRGLDLIERDITKDLSVGELASRLDLNPSYLSQVFKSVTGDHPSSIIARRKVEYAKMCFERYRFSVTETADLLGYSPSHFYRVFKAHTGVAPRSYIRDLKAG